MAQKTFLKRAWWDFYLSMAKEAAPYSVANKRKVGCVMVLPNGLISVGINGTPAGWPSNVCEDSKGETLPEVLHAEENAVAKLMNSTLPTTDAVVFVTTCPCRNCAKVLVAAKVRAVIFLDQHYEAQGLQVLLTAGISVYQATPAIDNEYGIKYTYRELKEMI